MNLHITQDLPDPVRTALEDLVSQINIAWQTEHKDDGTHKELSGEGNLIMGGFATFRTQLRCRVGFPSGTAQVIPNNTETVVLWEAPVNSEGLAPDGFFDNGLLRSRANIYNSANGYFTPPEQGLWLMLVRIYWANNAVGERTVYVRGVLGGVDYAQNTVMPDAATGVADTQELSVLIPYPDPLKQYEFGNMVPSPIRVFVLQTSGGNLNLATVTQRISCTLVKIA